MKKLLLLVSSIFFFAACNNAPEQKPDADRAIKGTFAQDMMQPFNGKPDTKKFYVKFQPKDKNFPRQQSVTIRQLLADMKPQPQRFTINPSEQNELQGEYGTKISLNANCFTTACGNETSSAINIELKECYTVDEMLQENLTTTGNNSVFESKAAVFVSATCNGEELKLKEGQKIDIQFPFAVNADNNYSFYYGKNNRDEMNWTPVDGNDVSAATAKDKITKPEFSYHGYDLKDYLASQLEYPDEAKRNELSANVEVTFNVDRGGKVQKVICTSAYKTFRDEIIDALKQMPKWKPATYGKKKISAQVKLNIDFNLRRKEQVVVEFSPTDIIPLTNAHTGGENNLPDAVYNQSFDRLGWISYNRVLDLPAAKADVIIRNDANCDVKLVFKNHNAIVNGTNCVGYSRFNNIPVSCEVYLVAVRNDNGNVFYSVQPLRLEKQTVVTIDWKKGNAPAMARALKSIS